MAEKQLHRGSECVLRRAGTGRPRHSIQSAPPRPSPAHSPWPGMNAVGSIALWNRCKKIVAAAVFGPAIGSAALPACSRMSRTAPCKQHQGFREGSLRRTGALTGRLNDAGQEIRTFSAPVVVSTPLESPCMKLFNEDIRGAEEEVA